MSPDSTLNELISTRNDCHGQHISEEILVIRAFLVFKLCVERFICPSDECFVSLLLKKKKSWWSLKNCFCCLHSNLSSSVVILESLLALVIILRVKGIPCSQFALFQKNVRRTPHHLVQPLKRFPVFISLRELYSQYQFGKGDFREKCMNTCNLTKFQRQI